MASPETIHFTPIISTELIVQVWSFNHLIQETPHDLHFLSLDPFYNIIASALNNQWQNNRPVRY